MAAIDTMLAELHTARSALLAVPLEERLAAREAQIRAALPAAATS